MTNSVLRFKNFGYPPPFVNKRTTGFIVYVSLLSSFLLTLFFLLLLITLTCWNAWEDVLYLWMISRRSPNGKMEKLFSFSHFCWWGAAWIHFQILVNGVRFSLLIFFGFCTQENGKSMNHCVDKCVWEESVAPFTWSEFLPWEQSFFILSQINGVLQI